MVNCLPLSDIKMTFYVYFRLIKVDNTVASYLFWGPLIDTFNNLLLILLLDDFTNKHLTYGASISGLCF